MGGVDKLDQFRSYYDVGRAGKNSGDIFFILILILLLLIILFVSKNQNQPSHAMLYYLIKMSY